MKLQDFLDETGIPVRKMARRCNISWHKLYHILQGGMPTLRTALVIKEYTKGKVQPEDLLPENDDKNDQDND